MTTIAVSVAILIISMALAFLCFLVNELLNPPWLKWYKLLSSGLRSHVKNCREAFHVGDDWDTPPLLVLMVSIVGAFMLSLLICGSLGLDKSFSLVWAYLTLSLPYWVDTFLAEPGDD